MRRKKAYKEGSIITVPLSPDGYGIGLITRINSSLILGYFIKKRFAITPSTKEINSLLLDEKSNLLVRQTESLGLDKGIWKVIGSLENWDRSQWPIPVFKRKIELTDKYYLVYYDDNLQNPKEEVTYYQSYLDELPNDSVAGYVFLETQLSKLFV